MASTIGHCRIFPHLCRSPVPTFGNRSVSILATPSISNLGHSSSSVLSSVCPKFAPRLLISPPHLLISPPPPLLLPQCRFLHESRQRVTLIPGDGVGPELMKEVKRVLDKFSLPLGYDEFSFSYQRPEEDNDDPEDIKRAIVKNRYCLAGHITPAKDAYLGTSLGIISSLDFFANVTYIKHLEGIQTRIPGVDIILVREQSEGEYKRMEHSVWSESSGEAVEALKVITRNASHRIVKFAFDTAVKHKRKKVTLVHKANIMKQGDGMFLNTGRKVAKLFPHIQFEDMIIDNMCMQMVWKPQQFDVVVTTNLYGNILENVGAGLVGGVGVVPGEDWSHGQIMFGMGVRHDGGKIAGKGIANPTYMFLSTSNMLRKLLYYKQSEALKKAVLDVLKEGKVLTKDLKGTATTIQYTDAVLEKMEHNMLAPCEWRRGEE